MSFPITATTQVMCPHGGAAVPSGFVPTVLIEGAPVVNQMYATVGCPFLGQPSAPSLVKVKTGSHHVFQFTPPCSTVLFQPAHPAVLAGGQPIAGTVGAVIDSGAPPVIVGHPVTVMIG